MFESLTEKLNTTFDKLRNKGKLTEKDVDDALREIRLALLEADVNFKVARSFISSIKEKVIGNDLLSTITAGQHVIKIAHEQLISILGEKSSKLLVSDKNPSVIMMVGLNGSGKTTTSSKLASFLKKTGNLPTLVGADIHRPAAIDQLKTLSSQIDVQVFEYGTEFSASEIAAKGLKDSQNINASHVIVDTAGRFQIDEALMKELKEIYHRIDPVEVLLVVDAMTGQEAVNIATEFNEHIGITGLVLTKMDGDARGGSALSINSVTGIPVKFIGMGEAPDQLEIFYPERLADRILGMGDVVTLVEKARSQFDETQTAELEKKIKNETFDLQDFLSQMQAVQNMGPIGQMLDMIPGFSQMKGKMNADQLDGSHLSKAEAIILSMTPTERQKPELIGGSRRKRIAQGSGTSAQDVNQLLNQFKQVKKMMKAMSSPGGQKKMMRMMSQKGNKIGF